MYQRKIDFYLREKRFKNIRGRFIATIADLSRISDRINFHLEFIAMVNLAGIFENITFRNLIYNRSFKRWIQKKRKSFFEHFEIRLEIDLPNAEC